MPRCTCASVPAKISAIPAARQTMVSFREVNRSTILRSMFLKSDRLNKFHEVLFFFFDGRVRSGRFEKPNSTVAPRPGREHARIRGGDVDCRKSCVAAFECADLRCHCGLIHRRQSNLLTPTIHVVDIASAVTWKH